MTLTAVQENWKLMGMLAAYDLFIQRQPHVSGDELTWLNNEITKINVDLQNTKSDWFTAAGSQFGPFLGSPAEFHTWWRQAILPATFEGTTFGKWILSNLAGIIFPASTTTPPSQETIDFIYYSIFFFADLPNHPIGLLSDGDSFWRISSGQVISLAGASVEVLAYCNYPASHPSPGSPDWTTYQNNITYLKNLLDYRNFSPFYKAANNTGYTGFIDTIWVARIGDTTPPNPAIFKLFENMFNGFVRGGPSLSLSTLANNMDAACYIAEQLTAFQQTYSGITLSNLISSLNSMTNLRTTLFTPFFAGAQPSNDSHNYTAFRNSSLWTIPDATGKKLGDYGTAAMDLTTYLYDFSLPIASPPFTQTLTAAQIVTPFVFTFIQNQIQPNGDFDLCDAFFQPMKGNRWWDGTDCSFNNHAYKLSAQGEGESAVVMIASEDSSTVADIASSVSLNTASTGQSALSSVLDLFTS